MIRIQRSRVTSTLSGADLSVVSRDWGLAELIAGAGRVRISRDGGRTYPRRYERILPEIPPSQPAAVLIYDASGCARTFCVDLDVSRGGLETIDRDLRVLSGVLREVGARWVIDRSPTGGVHVYIPLQTSKPYSELRETAIAMAQLLTSMDPMPMLGIASGCIRPPGSFHKSGGRQELVTEFAEAVRAFEARTSDEAWERLVARLPRPERSTTGREADAEDVVSLPSARRYREPDAAYQQIARTGDFPAERYATQSEARQAVIWSCVAAGWQFADVARRLHDGTWPGLAQMYARYSPSQRHTAVTRDWRSAIRFEKHRRETQGSSTRRVGTTSGLKTHAGGTYQQIRTWVTAVELVFDQDRRDALASRAVLMALAEAAMKTGQLEVEFGNRSLAIATGLDQATVGKVLNRLLEDEDPLIDRVRAAAGVRAALYALRLPGAVAEAARRRPWPRGKVYGIRAPFRELGLAAAFVYGALERATTPMSRGQVAAAAAVGSTTAHDALLGLAAFDLARHSPTGWILGDASLGKLAEQFGVDQVVHEQIQRYRAERRAYWAWLGIVRLSDETGTIGRYDDLPPPEDPDTLMDLLERELGAHVISEQRTA